MTEIANQMFCLVTHSGVTSWARPARWKFLFPSTAANTFTSSPNRFRSRYHPTHQVRHLKHRAINVVLQWVGVHSYWKSILCSAIKLFSPKSMTCLLKSPQTQRRRRPNEMLSHPQLCSTWTAEYMHGRGREAFCLGASRRIPNPYSLRAGTSWRSRTCRKTGTTLVIDGEFKTFILMTIKQCLIHVFFFFSLTFSFGQPFIAKKEPLKAGWSREL